MQQETPSTAASEVITVGAEAKSLTSSSPLSPSSTHFSPAYLSLLGSALLAACSGSGDVAGEAQQTGVQSDSASAQNADGSIAANMQDSVAGYKPAGTSANGTSYSAAGFNNFPVAYNTNDAARFLLQSQLNATDAEITAVSSGTFASYLQQQFANLLVELAAAQHQVEAGIPCGGEQRFFHVRAVRDGHRLRRNRADQSQNPRRFRFAMFEINEDGGR